MTARNRSTAAALELHLESLKNCARCIGMHKPVVAGRPVLSRVLLVGQAPGNKEPLLQRPFAWSAGKTLFQWFESAFGFSEEETRSTIYFAAVCRCFPGKKPGGGDRVPAPEEIENCSSWLRREFELLKPALVLAVGKLAIAQFLPDAGRPLVELVGKQFPLEKFGTRFDLVPLPHPSGASPWHRVEPGKTLLKQALRLIGVHPAFRESQRQLERKRIAPTGRNGDKTQP
jgi:uracil-DNA glycosylase